MRLHLWMLLQHFCMLLYLQESSGAETTHYFYKLQFCHLDMFGLCIKPFTVAEKLPTCDQMKEQKRWHKQSLPLRGTLLCDLIWDPQVLVSDCHVRIILMKTDHHLCLGVMVVKMKYGLLLHQQSYTEGLLKEHAAHLLAGQGNPLEWPRALAKNVTSSRSIQSRTTKRDK